jgi:tRNA G18 (ribose-2'-O)-methylase SpoU
MRNAVRQLVALPLASGVDSLNVAVAGAIAFHHFAPT